MVGGGGGGEVKGLREEKRTHTTGILLCAYLFLKRILHCLRVRGGL